MMGILPTGYGKTFIYTILPRVLDMLPGKHIGWHMETWCWSSEERLHVMGFGAVHLIRNTIDTRFNKIAIQCKFPYVKWTRKPLAYRESNIFNLCVIRPPEICVNLVFKHIHDASSYTICR